MSEQYINKQHSTGPKMPGEAIWFASGLSLYRFDIQFCANNRKTTKRQMEFNDLNV